MSPMFELLDLSKLTDKQVEEYIAYHKQWRERVIAANLSIVVSVWLSFIVAVLILIIKMW